MFLFNELVRNLFWNIYDFKPSLLEANTSGQALPVPTAADTTISIWVFSPSIHSLHGDNSVTQSAQAVRKYKVLQKK